jgi:hypothetical protein
VAFPSVATYATTADTSSGSVTVNMPSGISVGDLLIVFCAQDKAGVLTQSGGSDWTKIEQVYNSTDCSFTFFAKIAEGSDTLSLTSTDSEDVVCIAHRIIDHGVSDVSTDLTRGTASTGTDDSPDPPNCNPGVAADYLWLETFAADDDDETTPFESADYTPIVQLQSANNSSCLGASAYRNLNASAENPGVMAMAANEQWVAQTVAVPPAADTTQFSAETTSGSSAQATLQGKQEFSGQGVGGSSAEATLQGKQEFSGEGAGGSSAEATLQGKQEFAGQGAGGSWAQATLQEAGETVQFSGETVGGSSAQATLGGKQEFSGQGVGGSAAQAILSGLQEFSGQGVGGSWAQATLVDAGAGPVFSYSTRIGSYPRLKPAAVSPTGANSYTLFSTAIDGWGQNAVQLMGLYLMVLDIKHSHGGTLKLYKSEDRGTNWLQTDETALTPHATDSSVEEYEVLTYADWQIEWVNGGSDQTTWAVDMCLVPVNKVEV